MSIEEEPFRNYVRQICSTLIQAPFDVLVLVSGHGPADPSLRELSFQLVNKQYPRTTEGVVPAILISIFDFSPQIEKRFKMKPGKHADWREFLMLYHLLGESYFDSDRLRRMKDFKERNAFESTGSLVCGVPMEHRSTAGIIGDPLPGEETDLKTCSAELWEYLVGAVSERLFNDMDGFFKRGY